MLYLLYGSMNDYNEINGTNYEIILNINNWFDYKYKTEWLNTEFSKRVIKEIDKSEHIQDHLIMSPYLGAISPKEISGGAKGIITLMYDNLKDENETPIPLSSVIFGDNCTNLLLEVSNYKDIWINLEHFLKFNSTNKFKACFPNTGLIVENDIRQLNLEIINEKIKYSDYEEIKYKDELEKQRNWWKEYDKEIFGDEEDEY